MANIPLSRRTITITDSSVTPKVITIDHNGNFSGDYNAGGTNSVNYATGQIQAEFDAATTDPVVVVYQTESAQPIMGIFNFIKEDGERELVVCDQDVVNKYNASRNYFDGLPFSSASSLTTFTGDNTNFFSGTMYFGRNASNKPVKPRLILTNNKDVPVFFDDTGEIKGYNNTTDNPDYQDPADGIINLALHVFYVNERLVWLSPTLGNSKFPRRILWSGILDNSGNGDKYNVAGAGHLDISDQGVITAAKQEHNEITIWTTENIWMLSITADIDEPFRIRKIGASQFRGSNAPYSGVNWFGESLAIGRTGIITSDGRQASRIDDKLPNFTQKRVVQNNFNLITGGLAFEDAQFWWPYPDPLDDSSTSSRILVRNFEESSWSTYRFPTNVVGYFKKTEEIAWDDVHCDPTDPDNCNDPTWAQWDTTEDIWDELSWQDDAFITLTGDANGIVYYMVEDGNDQLTQITGVTQANGAVVTIEDNVFEVGDTIKIDGVAGLEENSVSVINDKEFQVTASSGSTITINLDSSDASAYSSGGYVLKGFQFSAKTKPLNPFVEEGKKARLRKVDFFMDADSGNFTVDFFIDKNPDPWKENVTLNSTADIPGQSKVWKTLTVNQIANFHSMRIKQKDTAVEGKFHAFKFWFEPVGRLVR
ncbi:MAG: ubiquitin-activating E1 FCCH domain-containing protein [Pseudomonadota bacterium]